jgi:four helix bundle protein
MGDYRDLVAWQRARLLTAMVYRSTERFPSRERYGLAAQMRRSVVSVLSNIAEGASRRSDPEFRRFIQIARGSLAELQSQITVACDLELLDETQGKLLVEAAGNAARVIHGLLRYYWPPPPPGPLLHP